MFKKNHGKYVVSTDKQLNVENNSTLRTANTAPDQAKSERKWAVIVSTLVAALGSVSFGYSLGYSSAAVTQLGNPNADLHLGQDGISWFSSLLNIGAMLGGPLGGWMIDRIGRRFTFMVTSAPFVAGWLLIGLGKHEATLHVGRFLSGVGAGLASLNVPVYISEVSSPRLRGAMGSVNQLGVTFGILLAYVVGDAFSWRYSAIAGVVTPVLLLVLMLSMPESPRWLIAQDKVDKSRATLRWLRGPNGDSEQEIQEVRERIANQETASLRDFTKPKLWRPLVLSLLLMFFQQFTGVNAFMFYCATIFEKAGFGEGSTTISIIIGVVQFLFTLLAVLVVDRAGRRILLLISGVGMLASCVTAGAYFYLTSNETDMPPWVAVASVSLYIVSFSLGWGPCAWLMIGELFSAKARGKGCGVSVFFNWSCSFIVTKTFASLIGQLTEAGTFWFYGGMAFLSVVFVYFFLPETKGKSLEEIEAWFENRGRNRTAPTSETGVA